MDSLQQYLPQHEGLLPKWLLFVSLVSVLNSIQAYAGIRATQKVYPGRGGAGATPFAVSSPVTPLSARTFGTWTLISSVVRLYAAYHVENKQVYELALWTYGVAWMHFVSEWFVFRTTRWGVGLAGPVFVASGSLAWMWSQRDFYVR